MGIKNVNVRIPDHVWKRIQEQRKREGVSQNTFIVQSIIKLLNESGYALNVAEDNTGPVDRSIKESREAIE